MNARLLDVLREARRLLGRPGNSFLWSSWRNIGEALAELDDAIARASRGELALATLALLFAPTGPIREVAAASGWGEELSRLAEQFELASSELTTPRIVSLLPAATEIVCRLGADDGLVGISHECDHPETIRDRQVLTRPRIDARAPSAEIDCAVRSNTSSIYELDDRLLTAIGPEVIITQDLCAVCAVSLDDVRRAVDRLPVRRRQRTRIVALRPTRLEHVFQDIERIASAIDRSTEGKILRGKLEQRVADIVLRARSAAAGRRPRVASIEWIDPLMLGGTWMPKLIEYAGGIAVGALDGQPAPAISSDQLVELRPDVVVIKPCGLSLSRALEERAVIDRSIVRAAPSARVYVADGNAYFNRPGPRIVESLEIMAACVHPSAFGDFREKHARAFVELR